MRHALGKVNVTELSAKVVSLRVSLTVKVNPFCPFLSIRPVSSTPLTSQSACCPIADPHQVKSFAWVAFPKSMVCFPVGLLQSVISCLWVNGDEPAFNFSAISKSPPV